MRNRIQHLLQQRHDFGVIEADRPRLTLKMERPFEVDMERFFDFTFSFAEALLDLEDKFQDQPKVTTLDRVLDTGAQNANEEFKFDVDARWM